MLNVLDIYNDINFALISTFARYVHGTEVQADYIESIKGLDINDFTTVILNMICDQEVQSSDPSYNKRQYESMRTIFLREGISDLALNLFFSL